MASITLSHAAPVTFAIRMAGSSTTSAPSRRNRSDSPDTRCRGRITMARTPNRGRSSCQWKRSASPQTLPTTMMAGVLTLALSASVSSVARVPSTRRCPAVQPFSSTAAGVSDGMPAFISPDTMSDSAATPIRNTSVPPVRASASKSMSSASPARRWPVTTWTLEQ